MWCCLKHFESLISLVDEVIVLRPSDASTVEAHEHTKTSLDLAVRFLLPYCKLKAMRLEERESETSAGRVASSGGHETGQSLASAGRQVRMIGWRNSSLPSRSTTRLFVRSTSFYLNQLRHIRTYRARMPTFLGLRLWLSLMYPRSAIF
jgi:hypothetical protein